MVCNRPFRQPCTSNPGYGACSVDNILLAIGLLLVNSLFLVATVLQLPGNWLMVTAVGGFILWGGAPGLFSIETLVALAIIAILAEIIEFTAGAAGTRMSGGSRKGALWAIAGRLVGGHLRPADTDRRVRLRSLRRSLSGSSIRGKKRRQEHAGIPALRRGSRHRPPAGNRRQNRRGNIDLGHSHDRLLLALRRRSLLKRGPRITYPAIAGTARER